MPKLRILLAWSSGKDSAWTLHVLRQEGRYEVVGLVTTINEAVDRVAMHAVRRVLLEAQADAAGLPLWPVPIPSPCSNDEYEAAMTRVIRRARDDGIEAFAFGDLFLADVRAYRERQLAGTGVAPLFPLWQRPTAALAREMLAGGLRAVLTCVDPQQLPAAFAGRSFDHALLADLPSAVDPCGENGEFHTFAHAGPMFAHDIAITVGEMVTRDGFVFADVMPATDRRRVNG
ncbi:MAG: adenine nucleotide alpha hydrolase [Deltaproteobacteria bacterium]|nr:adenine nucleotide alpha hydrolase [Deltaproteobacteria bacterium]MBI3391207.1 adenine nucleotide alpha hydrolase [Deltaproteobacteria bacterium]